MTNSPTDTPRPIATTTATPSRTPAEKPTPTPTPARLPAALTFGELSYSSNTCFEQVADSDGHALWGGVVKLSVTVKNSGQTASEGVWLVVEPTGLTNFPQVMKNSGLQTSLKLNNMLALKGPAVAPGKSSTLAASVFFEAPYRIDYRVHAVVADDAGLSSEIAAEDWANDWGDLWSSVSIC